MGKVAFCWELGGAFGHIMGFLPIAKRLQEQGHDVVFIVKDLMNTGQLVVQNGFKVYQAPFWHPRLKNLPKPVNYAEILFRFGYMNEDRVFEMVMGWKNLLEVIAPDLVVVDHSPTALIASRCISVKRTILGTGFFSPPQINPMPPIRPWANPSLERLQNTEKRALQSINGVLERIGVPGLENLMDLFDCDENFLATFPELDHYQNRGQVRYWGPRMSMDEGEDPVWPKSKDGPNIFAYLKGEFKDVGEVLRALKSMEANVLIYASRLAQKKIEMFQGENVVFSPKMLNLNKVCQKCDLVICHGGQATLARPLLKGIPVLGLPIQLEQFLILSNVVRFGAGVMVNPADKNKDYAVAIQRALTDENIKRKAKEFAALHVDFDQQKQIANIVNRIEELITPV